MFPGYPAQFSNGLPNNAQQAIPNPINPPMSSTIQPASTPQFQINLELQSPQSMNMLVQQQNNQQQTKSLNKQNQTKQLTILQSMQQKMPQPLQNQQQHQLQNVMVHHTAPQQIQQQSSQQNIQNSMMQNPLQHQPVQIRSLPIPQQQIIRPIITSPNGVNLQPTSIMPNQAQVSNHQIQPSVNIPQQIVTSPEANKDSHVHNILQQFAPQTATEPSLAFDDEFQVEGIAEEREIKGKRQYLVQWAGFSDDENTWEDESNLSRYYQLINDFRINGPKPRTQRRIVEFISGFVSNGKVNYNVLYQNDEVGTLTALQARGSRVKQQLINFLEREFSFPEKERIVIPPKPPKPPKSSNPTDSQKQTTSSAAAMSEYEYEYVEEEEEIENQDPSIENENIKIKKRIKKKRRIINASTDDNGSLAETETKDDVNDEEPEEIKMQKKILQDDPIENVDVDEM